MCMCLIAIMVLIFTKVTSLLVEPTISNTSGHFYIISQSNLVTFARHSIECRISNCFVICDSPNGCDHTIINTTNTSNLFLDCPDTASCLSIQMLSSATNTTSIRCMAERACSFGLFDLQHATHHISITCSAPSNTQYPCVDNTYYLPNRDTNIRFNCIGVGCYHFGDLYVPSNDTIALFNIYPCNQCDTHCIDNYTIHCLHSNERCDLFMDGNCTSNWCGCHHFKHEWSDDTNECRDGQNPKFNVLVNIIMGAVILCVFTAFFLLCVIKRSELTTKHSLYWQKKKKKQTKAHHNRGKEAKDEAQYILEENSRRRRDTNDMTTLTMPKSIFPDKTLVMRTYSMDQISTHCSFKSCWIVVGNKVLDVTMFLDYHPGNMQSILKYGGTNCDEHFGFHSTVAQQLFFKFMIGKVDANDGERTCVRSSCM
eukprot:255662_1